MWPFDIKRKKREAEARAEQRRLSEERLTAAVRRSGRAPVFSAPYGKQGSSTADDSSLLNPTSMLSPLNPVSPLYHGNTSTETGRSSSADQRCSAPPSHSSHSSHSSYDSGCGSSSSASSSDSGGGSGGDSGGGGGGGGD